MLAEKLLLRRMFSRGPRRGFTALELIIVVIIIGILAAAGMSKYKGFTTLARKNACVSNQEQLTAAVRLVENDDGPLASSTILRLHADGTIDYDSYLTGTATSASGSFYGVWVGTLPSSWGTTNQSNSSESSIHGGNSVVAGKAQENKIFRCPEDSNDLSSTYMDISQLTAGSTGVWSDSSDPCVYTFAKTYSDSSYARAATFTPSIPQASPADPLEGYNWLKNKVEWENTGFTFCRRWGLRDPSASGYSTTILNGVSGDYDYVPGGQETKLAHSQFAPTQ